MVCMQDMVPELRGSEIYRHLLQEELNELSNQSVGFDFFVLQLS